MSTPTTGYDIEYDVSFCEGQLARLRNLSEQDNPHPPADWQHDVWKHGWTTKDEELWLRAASDVARQAVTAWQAGQLLADNPHPSVDWQHQAWNQAWDARAEKARVDGSGHVLCLESKS